MVAAAEKSVYDGGMCGRFALGLPAKLLAALFGLEEPEDWEPRFNIAPSQPVLAVRAAGERNLAWIRPIWGLVPVWASGRSDFKPLINARAETITEKASFREAFRQRRCLIPADGFFEWQKAGRGKVPFCFHRRERRPFAFAGVWEPGRGDSHSTCTIVTTRANVIVASIHDRMPVMLTESSFNDWLQGTSDTALALCGPFPDEDMVCERVSARVNSPAHDDETCIRPEKNLLDFPDSR